MIPSSAIVLLSAVSIAAPAASLQSQFVTIPASATHRIAGKTEFPMPDVLAREMNDTDKEEVDYRAEVCVGTDGVPRSIQPTQRTGVRQADRRVEKTVMSWRYAPYVVAGRAVAFCTPIRYRFEMPVRPSRLDW